MIDKYTRWMDLFDRDEQIGGDETLRPAGLHYEKDYEEGCGWDLTNPEILDCDLPITDAQAELLIAAQAIKWFNTKHEGLTIGDGHFDDKYQGQWPSGISVRVFSPVIDEIRSGSTLVDALYELVVMVLERIEADLLHGH